MFRTASSIVFLFLGSVCSAVTLASPLSAYAGQEQREIKSLSSDDIQSYLGGKGAGLARAAELNGYAGPAHVLELGQPLALTAEQRSQTEALFAAMERKAIALGAALVEAERKLDAGFATKAITPTLLAHTLNDIGALQAQLRAVHLQAHLEQIALLTPEQNARYAVLRGYKGQSAPQGSAHHAGH